MRTYPAAVAFQGLHASVYSLRDTEGFARSMNTTEPERKGYDSCYESFNSPLQKQLRREAYGQDIGQHSWVTADELEQDIPRLGLSRTSRLLDLGCGPGGPLAFIAKLVGCQGSGTDISAHAIAAARVRIASLGLGELITLQVADLRDPIPHASGSFDAVMSMDVVLHLPDRTGFVREVARVLVPGGRFLFTDAGIITGAISDEGVRLRAVHGRNHLVPAGFNERILELAGLRLLESHDRTQSLLKNARGRLTARLGHRAELEKLEGSTAFEREQRYLETVINLSERGSLSRMAYLAESRVAAQ